MFLNQKKNQHICLRSLIKKVRDLGIFQDTHCDRFNYEKICSTSAQFKHNFVRSQLIQKAYVDMQVKNTSQIS